MFRPSPEEGKLLQGMSSEEFDAMLMQPERPREAEAGTSTLSALAPSLLPAAAAAPLHRIVTKRLPLSDQIRVLRGQDHQGKEETALPEDAAGASPLPEPEPEHADQEEGGDGYERPAHCTFLSCLNSCPGVF